MSDFNPGALIEAASRNAMAVSETAPAWLAQAYPMVYAVALMIAPTWHRAFCEAEETADYNADTVNALYHNQAETVDCIASWAREYGDDASVFNAACMAFPDEMAGYAYALAMLGDPGDEDCGFYMPNPAPLLPILISVSNALRVMDQRNAPPPLTHTPVAPGGTYH
ncbi:MAG: hypothetical protein WBH52_28260 [Pseudomonas aeruginosa]